MFELGVFYGVVAVVVSVGLVSYHAWKYSRYEFPSETLQFILFGLLPGLLWPVTIAILGLIYTGLLAIWLMDELD